MKATRRPPVVLGRRRGSGSDVTDTLLDAQVSTPPISAWRSCYTFFHWAPEASLETAALHLGFYLSTLGLAPPAEPVWSDHTIHIDAVRLILDKRYALLRDLRIKLRFLVAPAIEDLRQELHGFYGRAAPGAVVQPIASAAILVTLGCVAGSDGAVAEGMKKAGLEPPSCYDELNETLNHWADAHDCEIAEAQRQWAERDVHFPQMRLVDLYFRIRAAAARETPARCVQSDWSIPQKP